MNFLKVAGFLLFQVIFFTSCYIIYNTNTNPFWVLKNNLRSKRARLNLHFRVFSYPWIVSEFSECSLTCGGGSRTRSVKCLDEDGIISDRCVKGAPTPSPFEACNTVDCSSGSSNLALTPGMNFTSFNPDGSVSNTSIFEETGLNQYRVIVITNETNGWFTNFTLTVEDLAVTSNAFDYIRSVRIYFHLFSRDNIVLRFGNIVELNVSDFGDLIYYNDPVFFCDGICEIISPAGIHTCTRVIYYDGFGVYIFTNNTVNRLGTLQGYFQSIPYHPGTVLIFSKGIVYFQFPGNPRNFREEIVDMSGQTNYTINLKWFGTQVYPVTYGSLTSLEIYSDPILPELTPYGDVLFYLTTFGTVTLQYNVEYLFSIYGINAYGPSDATTLLVIHGYCGDPMPVTNGSLGNHTGVREGDNVTYWCSDGFRPSTLVISECTSTGLWIPAPEKHNCTLVTASVTLNLNRGTDRFISVCLGDIISYNCSILSNSETVHLTWHVTFPGLMPINITYDNNSILNTIDNLPLNTTIILTGYMSDEYIESIITFVVSGNYVLDGTQLECRIGDLDNKTEILIFNSVTSAPPTPTGLNITGEYYTEMDNTVMFEWDPPPPDAILDNYTIIITPRPVSHPTINTILSSPFNVTLNYNVMYTATITALNCAGESDSFILSNIEYYIDCGDPLPPVNGSLGNYTNTIEGATVIYQCNDQFVPSDVMISMCTSNTSWIPAPEEHICTIVKVKDTKPIDRIFIISLSSIILLLGVAYVIIVMVTISYHYLRLHLRMKSPTIIIVDKTKEESEEEEEEILEMEKELSLEKVESPTITLDKNIDHDKERASLEITSYSKRSRVEPPTTIDMNIDQEITSYSEISRMDSLPTSVDSLSTSDHESGSTFSDSHTYNQARQNTSGNLPYEDADTSTLDSEDSYNTKISRGSSYFSFTRIVYPKVEKTESCYSGEIDEGKYD